VKGSSDPREIPKLSKRISFGVSDDEETILEEQSHGLYRKPIKISFPDDSEDEVLLDRGKDEFIGDT